MAVLVNSASRLIPVVERMSGFNYNKPTKGRTDI